MCGCDLEVSLCVPMALIVLTAQRLQRTTMDTTPTLRAFSFIPSLFAPNLQIHLAFYVNDT